MPSDSCQTGIQSDTQRETVGHREEGVRRSMQREEEEDTGVTAMLAGQQSRSECVWSEREARIEEDLTHRNLKNDLGEMHLCAINTIK